MIRCVALMALAIPGAASAQMVSPLYYGSLSASDLAPYVKFSDLSAYATTASVTSGLAAKADTSSLSSYATNASLTAGLSTKADVTALSARPGVAAYRQTATGPMTTGTGTTTLLGGNAVYGFGSSSGKPILRCDYVGQSYHAYLHGNYSLATLSPGTVTAILLLGTTSYTLDIGNFLAGTPGAWWDAEADITCASVGTNSATINFGATISFQAAGGVTAASPVARGVAPKTITTNAGAFTFDLQRTFSNASNTMQIETLQIMWVG